MEAFIIFLTAIIKMYIISFFIEYLIFLNASYSDFHLKDLSYSKIRHFVLCSPVYLCGLLRRNPGA